MNNQNVLALDLATNTGWAIRLRDGTIKSGHYNIRATGGASKAQRWVNFRLFLSDMIAENDVHIIAFEDVKRHVSTLSAHTYGGLIAITEMTAQTRNIPVNGLGVGTIKKHWTGKGNAKKEDMIATARAKGFDVSSDDEADALAILHTFLKI